MDITPPRLMQILTILTLLAANTSADDGEPSLLPGRSESRIVEQQIVNVALREDGIIRGRVVEADGTPLDGARVVLSQTDRVVATVVTDVRGEFEAAGLGSGVYRIETPTSAGAYRFWRAGDAPPSAKRVALIVSQQPTLRAQYGSGTGLLALGVGAAGLTAGIVSYEKAEDAEAAAKRVQKQQNEMIQILQFVSP